MSVKAITFDLDDTLWPLKPTLIRAEKETYNWLTKNAKPLTDNYSIRDIAEFRYQLFRNKPQFHNQISKVRIATIKELALLSEYSEQDAQALAEQSFEVHYALRQQVNCFEGVEELLEKLSDSFVLGAISNGNADVNKTVIGKYFSFALSAEQLNASKPDEKIFNHAHRHIEDKLGAAITTRQIVHVGDDFHCDIIGAKRADFKAIWLDDKDDVSETDKVAGITGYENEPSIDADIEADAIIKNINELPAALASLSAQ